MYFPFSCLANQERVSGRDGRRRFDPDGTNPYAYVNVLLYTQQLEAAVSFLSWKGQHLAVRVADWSQVAAEPVSFRWFSPVIPLVPVFCRAVLCLFWEKMRQKPYQSRAKSLTTYFMETYAADDRTGCKRESVGSSNENNQTVLQIVEGLLCIRPTLH